MILLNRLANQIIRITISLALGMGVASCSPLKGLPDGAFSALEGAWLDLDPAYAAKLHISRAWRSQARAEELTAWAPDTETWCVEVEGPAGEESLGRGETIIWTVTRPDRDSPWSAAMLMTMSAMWPYQACAHALQASEGRPTEAPP